MALRDLFRGQSKARDVERQPAPSARARPDGEISITQLRATLRARPDHVAARLILADRLSQRGEVEQAIVEYRTVVHSYVEHDLHAKAARLLRRVTELAPDRTDLTELLVRLSEIETTLPRRDLQIARLARRPTETLEPASLDAAELRRYWNEFGASPFVRKLDDDALALLFSACEVQQISPMSVVVRAGQSQPRCYLVAEGVIDATRTGADGTPVSVLRFVPGDVIGDRALLDGAPWAAQCRTPVDETATALRLTRRSLESHADDEGQLRRLYDALRQHGRDRDLAALVGTFSKPGY